MSEPASPWNKFPKHSNDFEAVEWIKNADISQVELMLPKMLVWTQDSNWPMCRTVSKLLPRFESLLVPYIIDILNYDDDTWKWHLICCTLTYFSPEFIEQIRPALLRIRDSPTKGEIIEEVPEEVDELFKHMGLPL